MTVETTGQQLRWSFYEEVWGHDKLRNSETGTQSKEHGRA